MPQRYKPLNIWCLLYPIAWCDDDADQWFTRDLGERIAAIQYDKPNPSLLPPAASLTATTAAATANPSDGKSAAVPPASPPVPTHRGFHVIGANWSVDQPQPSWKGYGHSTIFAPNGSVIATAQPNGGIGDQIIYADIPVDTSKPPPAVTTAVATAAATAAAVANTAAAK